VKGGPFSANWLISALFSIILLPEVFKQHPFDAEMNTQGLHNGIPVTKILLE